MKQSNFIFSFILVGMLCYSVSGQERKRIVWPSAPDRPRIEFLYAVSGVKDIGIEKSIFKKMWEWITGPDAEEGFLVKPMSVTTDKEGRMYVTDPGAKCVHIFDRFAKEYKSIKGDDKIKLESPVAVAVAQNNLIYVSDSELKKVIVIDQEGKIRFTIDKGFERPTGIVVHHGKLYVVDTVLHAVLVFDLNGSPLFRFGKRGTGEGEFNYPVFLSARQDMVLGDAMNFRVQIMSDSGSVKNVFGAAGDVAGSFARPKGVAFDTEEHVYVADGLFNAIQIFDKTGRLLLVFGSTGVNEGEFQMPAGLFIDEDDKIYIADSMNRRVQVFQYLK